MKNFQNLKTKLSRRGYTLYKDKFDNNLLSKIKNELTVKPFTHKNFINNVKPFPVFYESENKLYLPRFYGLEKFGTPDLIDLPEGENRNLKCICKPRDKLQENLINEITEILYKKPTEFVTKKIKRKNVKLFGSGCILSIPCGYGKTIISLIIASKLKAKTLIVVHTSVLLDQWIKRINQFLPETKIGIIKGKKMDVEDKDIVIGMLQTLSSNKKIFPRKLFNSFKFTIIDEVHRAAAPTFSRALPIISSRYLLGLTATPNRSDNLQKVFFWHLGNIGNTLIKAKENNLLIKRLIYRSENYKEIKIHYPIERLNLHKMLEQILEEYNRNKFIVKQVMYWANLGRQILLLSTRKLHLKYLKENIDRKIMKKDIKYDNPLKKIFKDDENNNIIINTIKNFVRREINTGYYIGGMKTKDLEISSKKSIILATYQLVSEGTDIKTLNTLVMATPRKEVEQVVGRILRAKTKFNPIVLDIVDYFSIYINQSKYRAKYYKKAKYNITDIEHEINMRVIKDTDKYEIKNKKNKRKKFGDDIFTKCLL